MSNVSSISESRLRIFRRESPVGVLGPFARAVVWVQGCGFGCAGCIVPESWDAEGGVSVGIDELTEWTLAQPGIEGITLSGGEPMGQAETLCEYVDRLRAMRDLGVVCYTGHTVEHLRARGTAGQRGLLERVDLLIDGVYRANLHADRLWRGSSNQRLLNLTQRYTRVVGERLAEVGDIGAGVEVTMDDAGGIGFAGVPARAGFREEFVRQMSARGIQLAIGDR